MFDTIFDACLPALKFVHSWFVTYKMLEKLNNIVFSNDDIDSDIVTFFSDGKGYVAIDLHNIKGATKLYFKNNLCIVIILFNTSLCKSAFSTYSFGKPVL